MRTLMTLVLAAAGATGAFAAKTLEMYFIDVEGGQATLIITPAGQTMLVDTGWRGYNGRDADRIAAAAKKVHIKKLDYVLITHYHRDHVGGAPQLIDRIPIETFIDHGPNTEQAREPKEDYADYLRILPRAQHLVVKAGDTVPLKGVDVRVVSSNGEVISTPLQGAGEQNEACAGAQQKEPDPTENAHSLGFVLTWNNFRFLDLGDLTWNKELQLMCPVNRIGHIDLFLVSHHGFDQSNSPQLVDAIHPRVAVMDNGARKGGSPSAWQIVHSAPGLQDLWQLHYAVEGGKDHNAPDPFIANLYEQCQGKYLRLTVREDGSFTLLNSRNNFEKDYPAR
ncbi:MAG TPA: MBL fold metallo-hydrolase [Bryobacteraceae bacterium]|nr:MBL fold metallo-hydrolase [Bryobacteraceae bacterium]